MLNKKLPFNATLFPFLHVFRTCRSSSCSASRLRSVTFSLWVASKARVIRSVYLLISDGRPVTCLSSVCRTLFAARSSVPSGGELDDRDRSRLAARMSVRGGEDRVVGAVANFSSTTIGLRSCRPVARQPLNMLADLRAFSRARIYISVHFTRFTRLESSLEMWPASTASARFSGENTLKLRGWSMCEVCGGGTCRSIACFMQYAITFAVIWLPWPSMINRRRRAGSFLKYHILPLVSVTIGHPATVAR